MTSALLLVLLSQFDSLTSPTRVQIVSPVDGGRAVSVSLVGTGSTTKISDGTDTALVSGSGALNVTCDNCGGSTFEDNDAFTPGTSSVNNAGLEVDDTGTTAITENSAGAQRMTTFRSAHTVLRDSAGNERGANVTAGNALVVDGSASTQPVSGTVAVTGVATAANQTTVGNQTTKINDGTDTALVSAAGALLVDATATTQPISGTVTVGTFPDNEPVAQGTAASSANRWKVQLTDGTDDNLVSAAGALVVDGSGVTQPVSGTVTVGTFPDNEPVAQGTAASSANRWKVQLTDGTDDSLVSAAGGLVVDGSGVTQPVSGTVTAAQATASSLNAEVQGDAAHAAAVSGNPVLVGAYAEADAAALDSTGVADGEVSRLKTDLEGRLLVTNAHPFRFHASSGLSTATTLTEIQTAPGASVSLYITDVVMSASVASTTTTDQQLTLKYGTGTNCGTGTTYITACFNQANGGCALHFVTPIKVPANTDLCWMHAAAGSKVVSVMGFTAP